MMVKGCIGAGVLPLRCFLFLLPTYIYTCSYKHLSHHDKREVLQQEYSQQPILPSPYFRWVLNIEYKVLINNPMFTPDAPQTEGWGGGGGWGEVSEALTSAMGTQCVCQRYHSAPLTAVISGGGTQLKTGRSPPPDQGSFTVWFFLLFF